MKRRNNKILSICIGASVVITNLCTINVSAEINDECIRPHEASYGYYVDVYKNNNSDNMEPETNPSIGVLSRFLDLWTPGSEWNNGIKINSSILDKNIENSREIAATRNREDERKAYLDDRRHQSYSIISGLGPYSEEFKEGSNAGTTIGDIIPDDADTVLYADESNSNGVWADEESEYGNIVKLVNTIRGDGSSTSSAKKYYKYMRPFRWENGSIIQASLIPAKKSDPSNDGGFPSGHTNAAYLTAYALAYAVPERYDELITRASELGNNRIVCGMHSCMDVMGGRVMATAVAASILNNSDNENLKRMALEEGEKLLSQDVESNIDDEYGDYESNKEKYIKRLTYGMKQIGDTTKEMRVPKGAEVLLESRLPYLDSVQRRYVLYTTGVPSGYPVLDDDEGWGRLNLFEASNGYGSFIKDVTVNMDASKGGFNKYDTWKNDIDGEGSLTKEGTGTLGLSGNNTYDGGTIINEGTINIKSTTALGNGKVVNNAKLSEEYNGEIRIKGSYEQDEDSVLELNLSSNKDILNIEGDAEFNGKLIINFVDGYKPDKNLNLITYDSNNNTKFTSVSINGLDDNCNKYIVYKENEVVLVDETSGSTSSSSKNHSHHHSSSSDSSSSIIDNASSISETANSDNAKNEKVYGWNNINGKWYFILSEGSYAKGWYKDISSNKWYMLDRSTGEMKTGWFQDINDKWYMLGGQWSYENRMA